MTLILVILLVALMIPVAAVVLDSPLGRALANRVERPDGRDITGGARIAQLEAEVERLSKEVSRLDDEAAFVRKLLDQRATDPQLPSGGNHTAS